MRKIAVACLVCVAVVLAVSCTKKSPKSETVVIVPSAESAVGPPRIDTSKAGQIDDLLRQYEEIVAKYVEDQKGGDADATSADEKTLAEVSDGLGNLAKDFSPDQLGRYNGITAKLSGE